MCQSGPVGPHTTRDGEMSRQGRPRSGHDLPSLTGLRFVAATAVFGYHFLYLLGGRAQSALLPVFGRGGAGVGLFFVLSGFVLTWSRRPDDTAGEFYRRRVARIYPVYLVAWIAAGVVLVALDQPLDGRKATLTALLVQSWVPDWHVYFGWNGVAWSLSCEAFFYAVFPFAIAWLERCRPNRRRAVGALLLSVTIGSSLATSFATPASGLLYPQIDNWGWLVYICPLGRLPEFLLGCLLALELRAGRLPRIPVAFALLATVAAYRAAYDAHHLTTQTGMLVVPFALLVVALAQADAARSRVRLLATAPAVALGDWSYSFYLLHGFAIGMIAAHRAPTSGLAAALLMMVVVAAAVWLVSAGMFRLVERPMARHLRVRHGAAPTRDPLHPRLRRDASPFRVTRRMVERRVEVD